MRRFFCLWLALCSSSLVANVFDGDGMVTGGPGMYGLNVAMINFHLTIGVLEGGSRNGSITMTGRSCTNPNPYWQGSWVYTGWHGVDGWGGQSASFRLDNFAPQTLSQSVWPITGADMMVVQLHDSDQHLVGSPLWFRFDGKIFKTIVHLHTEDKFWTHEFIVSQDGIALQRYYLAPGSADALVEIRTPNGNPIQVFDNVEGLGVDSTTGLLRITGSYGDVVALPSGAPITPSIVLPNGNPEASPTISTVIGTPSVSPPSGGAGANPTGPKTIAEAVQGTGGGSTGNLTGDQFSKGMQQINDALSGLAGKSGGGGGAIDLSPITTRQDAQTKIMDGTDLADLPAVSPMPTTPVSVRTFAELGVEALVPAPLVIENALDTTHGITLAFDIPGLGGPAAHFAHTWDFTAAPYSTPISIFRGALLVVLVGAFWLGTLAAIRGAFADKS